MTGHDRIPLQPLSMNPDDLRALADWIRHMYENGMTLAHIPEMRQHLNNLGRWEAVVVRPQLVAAPAASSTQTMVVRDALLAAKAFADDEFIDCIDLPRKTRISKLCDKIDAALKFAPAAGAAEIAYPPTEQS